MGYHAKEGWGGGGGEEGDLNDTLKKVVVLHHVEKMVGNEKLIDSNCENSENDDPKLVKNRIGKEFDAAIL